MNKWVNEEKALITIGALQDKALIYAKKEAIPGEKDKSAKKVVKCYRAIAAICMVLDEAYIDCDCGPECECGCQDEQPVEF